MSEAPHKTAPSNAGNPSALDSVKIAALAADARKGQDIVALHVHALTTIADYFLFVTATSSTQVNAIFEAIDVAMSKAGREPLHVEGRQESQWILMDYADVIIHIFMPDQRAFYGLERLWGDAPRVDLELPTPG
ncbi:MAG: ribosome silencing factor [Nitrospirae bacterium]|nr:ribosome silencing factor [Nitrospirota bacterium]